MTNDDTLVREGDIYHFKRSGSYFKIKTIQGNIAYGTWWHEDVESKYSSEYTVQYISKSVRAGTAESVEAPFL